MFSPLHAFRLAVFFAAFNVFTAFFPCFALPAQEGAGLLFDNIALPESVTLCGEPIPLENPNVYEMLDREFTILVWDRAQVFLWLKRAGRYFPYIEKRLAEAGMPDDLKYLAVAESSLLTYAKSSHGAKGPWQLMGATARSNGIRNDYMIDERLDFEQATDVALKFLEKLKDKFGSWALALAAYNCGEGCVKKEIREQGVTDYYRLNLPLETERFVFRIAAIKTVMKDPAHYGYRLAQEQIYKPTECDTVPVKIRIALHITEVARALDTEFKVLRELNPKIPGYYLPAGKYTMKVPHGKGSKVSDVVEELTQTASRLNRADHFHIVQPGDTLSGISMGTGIPMAMLKKLNRIKGSLIRVGQKLRLKR